MISTLMKCFNVVFILLLINLFLPLSHYVSNNSGRQISYKPQPTSLQVQKKPRKWKEKEIVEHWKSKLTQKLYTIPVRYISEVIPRQSGVQVKNSGKNDLPCQTVAHPSQEYLMLKNYYWQLLPLENDKNHLWLYTAHIDNRTLNGVPAQFIRVLAHNKRENNRMGMEIKPLYCYSWYDKTGSGNSFSHVRITSVTNITDIRNNYGIYDEMMINCHLRGKPVAVSLSSNPCVPRPYNLIEISKPELIPEGFLAVCVSRMFSFTEDYSSLLLEWFEILKTQEVDHVFIYVMNTHRNMMRVMQLYEREGFATYFSIGFEDQFIDFPWFNEFVMRTKGCSKSTPVQRIVDTDCFYRVHSKFKYVALQDFDEVFLPSVDLKNLTLVQYLKKRERDLVGKRPIGSFRFVGALFASLYSDMSFMRINSVANNPGLVRGVGLLENKQLWNFKDRIMEGVKKRSLELHLEGLPIRFGGVYANCTDDGRCDDFEGVEVPDSGEESLL